MTTTETISTTAATSTPKKPAPTTTPTKKEKKSSIQEFEGQVKDIRQQLTDQLRCLETRTDVETAILAEIQDYFKRRADIELDYARNLEKLSKQIGARHKAEKQKREQWQVFSLYNWWLQLVEDTKTEARNRSVAADLYSHYVVSKLASQSEQLQRISKRCREIGADAHQEILRVLGELLTAMKTYQLCHVASANAETKFKSVEGQKLKFEESYPNKVGSRKYRFVEKDFEKKQTKFLDLQLKTLKARNEYILCIGAANAALHKYFADDLSNLTDCMDVGTEQWLSMILSTLLEAQRHLSDVNGQQSTITKSWLQDFDARTDKRRFLEVHHATFTLPRKFEFRPINGDLGARELITPNNGMEEELRQRYNQLERRLRELRTENEEIWKTYETAERKLMEIQRQPELRISELFNPPQPPQTPPIQPQSAVSGSSILTTTNPMTTSTTAIGVLKNEQQQQASSRNSKSSCRESETIVQKRKLDSCEMEDYLLQKFHQYLLTANLINRLEARHHQIQNALGISPAVLMSASMTSFANGGGNARDSAHNFQSIDAFLDSCHSMTSSFAAVDGSDYMSSSTLGRLPSLPPKSRRKRVGRSGELTVASGGSLQFDDTAVERRPRLFGGSLEEYVEATGEEIPLIIRSCIRMLSTYGMHHQGVFRVSGSQLEINVFKDSFERGDDPLVDVTDASDVNSVAGVLKLYFRELLEPLFPMFMFDQFVECARGESKADIILKIRDLLRTLPRPVYVVMRYLFGFLNHLSEFSDENMMDPYNLAICFGPTLLPIPESRDQVFFHNHVNELMKNMIICHEEIFPKDEPLLSAGIQYEKYLLTTTDDMGCTAINELNEDDEADGAIEEAGGHYETVLTTTQHGNGNGLEKAGTIGSSGRSLTNKITIEHAYEEYQPAVFGVVTTVDAESPTSPTNSTEPATNTNGSKSNNDGAHLRAAFPDELNLSNHGSLQASPDSPADQTGNQQHDDEVWLRRRVESPPFVDSPSHPDENNVQLRIDTSKLLRASADRSIGENSLDQRTSSEYGAKEGSRETDGDDSHSSSSVSNHFPREYTSGSLASAGKPVDITNASLQFRTSTSSSTYSEIVPNGGGSRDQSLTPRNGDINNIVAPTVSTVVQQTFARNSSVSSEPAKPASRRECKLGSLKRLSLSSYGVPATPPPAAGSNGSSNGRPSPPNQLPLNNVQQQDLEFIQQTDFSSSADGLSPTSLKEIQSELKAVLSSLESFTIQQHKSKPVVVASGPGDHRNSTSSPEETTAGGPDRPDLVQNLPSPASALSDAAPSSPLATIGCPVVDSSSVVERFLETKESTIKKADHSSQSPIRDSSSSSINKPSTARKPGGSIGTSSHSPSPASFMGARGQFSSIDSSSEGYNEEAML